MSLDNTQISLTFPDGATRAFPRGVTARAGGRGHLEVARQEVGFREGQRSALGSPVADRIGRDHRAQHDGRRPRGSS